MCLREGEGFVAQLTEQRKHYGFCNQEAPQAYVQEEAPQAASQDSPPASQQEVALGFAVEYGRQPFGWRPAAFPGLFGFVPPAFRVTRVRRSLAALLPGPFRLRLPSVRTPSRAPAFRLPCILCVPPTCHPHSTPPHIRTPSSAPTSDFGPTLHTWAAVYCAK